MSVPGEAREEAGGSCPGNRFESCKVRRLVLDAAEAVVGWDRGWEEQQGDDLQPAQPKDCTVGACSSHACSMRRGVHLPHLQHASGCAAPI